MLNASSARLIHTPHKASLHGSSPSAHSSSELSLPRSSTARSAAHSLHTRALPNVNASKAQAGPRDHSQRIQLFRIDQVQLSYSSHQIQRMSQAPDSCCELDALLGYVEDLLCDESEHEFDIEALMEELVAVVDHPQSQLTDEVGQLVFELIDTLEMMMSEEEGLMNHVEEAWSALTTRQERDEADMFGAFSLDSHDLEAQFGHDQAMSMAHEVSFEIHINFERHVFAQVPQSHSKVQQLLT